jgi:hypothetical protein
MGPTGVIILHILLQGTIKVTLVENDKAIQTFLTNGSYPAFRIGVSIRRPDWCMNNPDTR